MTLPSQRLGTTTLEISRVGLGAWAMGGGEWFASWGAQDDRESVAAIEYAVSVGINWVDTAAVYGLGHSEEMVGRALRSMPEGDRPYVFTKCGQVADAANRQAPAQGIGRPQSIRAECEASLRRLGVERIDVLQMHWPPSDGTGVDDYWATLVALREEGKIAAAGLSNHDTAQLDRAEAIGHVDSLQPPFSLVNRVAGADVVPWCESHGTGVVVYSPMESGLLTGTFSSAKLGEGDWRRSWPPFIEGLDAKLELAAALGPIAERHDTTPGTVAVAWTLAWPGVAAAIVGARRPEQIDGWIGAAGLVLSPGDLAELAAAVERTGAGSGPVAPPAA